MVVTPKGYTKHYYNGSQRIAAQIGKLEDLSNDIIDTSAVAMERIANARAYMDAVLNISEIQPIDTTSIFADIEGDALDELQWQCNDEEWTLNTTVHCDSNLLYPILTKDTTNLNKRVSDIYYYHPDHLGNVREVWVHPWLNHSEYVQRTQYYPSGLPWNEGYSPSEQPYKYGGKEFVEMHGLDEYDSEARWYYPAIMRTTTMDPHCEQYYDTSPYTWCGNNAVNNIDSDGRDGYDAGDGNIIWDDRAISQESMNQIGLNGVYLGKNVLVGKHGRDENLNEDINGAIFELYLDTYKEGATASIIGNTIPCDINCYGTLKEGRYPATYQEYHGQPAILINGGGDLPTVKGNPNNAKNYFDKEMKIPKPVEMHVMDAIFFHYGNNYFPSLIDSKKRPWTTGCQTGGNYKGAWIDYKKFMQNVPTTFNGWYYLRAK